MYPICKKPSPTAQWCGVLLRQRCTASACPGTHLDDVAARTVQADEVCTMPLAAADAASAWLVERLATKEDEEVAAYVAQAEQAVPFLTFRSAWSDRRRAEELLTFLVDDLAFDSSRSKDGSHKQLVLGLILTLDFLAPAPGCAGGTPATAPASPSDQETPAADAAPQAAEVPARPQRDPASFAYGAMG